MKNKGFTVIELSVSFVLVSVISIILFQLIFSLKELYISGDIKTTLLNKQGIMTKKINDDLINKDLINITSCGVSCLTFEYSEGSARLLVDVGANTITYDNYTMKLTNGSNFGDINFTIKEEGLTAAINDSVFSIDIPITTKFLKDDFGIHITKLYNRSNTIINNHITLANATIIANGVEIPLAKINLDGEVIVTSESTTIALSGDAIFTKLFHQDNLKYFTTYEEFLKSKDTTKMSTLKSLEVFRSKENNVALNNAAIDGKNQIEIDKINESFQNGYFQLILDYPNITSGVGSLVNYNHFIQTSNFTNNVLLENSYNIDTIYSGNGQWLSGLKYQKDDNSYVSGTGDGTHFTIGMKPSFPLIGPNTEVPSVDIWVRADEYITKYALSIID